MAETENQAPVDWGHLDALVTESQPTSNWVERMDLGFEQIAESEIRIGYLKERLASTALHGSKKVKVECQLADLESKLVKLKAGHEEGAKVLRQKAVSLATLPRELRDAIFEQIYVQDDPIEVSWSRLGSNYVYSMPKDPALYMSWLHVGPELAREAAEIFYKQNTFTFVHFQRTYDRRYDPGFTFWGQAQLDDWFSRDHYRSGATPKDFVRNIELRLDRPGHCYNGDILYDWSTGNEGKLCNHIDFESICNNIGLQVQDYRARVVPFRQYDTLQSIRFIIPQLDVRLDTAARILNPVVRELRDTGLKVTLLQHSLAEDEPISDLSSIFDPPSDEDYAEYYEVTQRKSVFTDDPHRELFDTWKVVDTGNHAIRVHGKGLIDVYLPADLKLGFMRVRLYEHYEMHKFITRDRDDFEAIDLIVQEYRNLSLENRSLRQRIYPLLMDYIR